MKKKYNSIVAFILCFATGFMPVVTFGAISNDKITKKILFPVIGATRFSNDFKAARVGHLHQGNDIMGKKGQQLIAAVDGTVEWVLGPGKGQTLGFSITDNAGYSYWYIHVNNDTPGTDDGNSRGIFAYAPDVYRSNPVVKGQLLGWMGDSGNAESTLPHLHFEIHKPNGDAVNPYYSLIAAQRTSRAVTAPQLSTEMLPYGQFSGGASIAIGDVLPSNDGNEIITGAGIGGGPEIRVLSESGIVLTHFMAFDSTSENKNGLDVAVGDTTGDGYNEIIVGSGPGRPSEVRIFDVLGTQLTSFQPYGKGFKGGINVASADLTSDGIAEIVTAPRKGGGPDIRVFDASGNPQNHFLAYGEGFRGGVDIAAIAETETSPAIIITAAGVGGGPHIKVLNRYGIVLSHFFSGAKTDRHGVRVAIADIEPAFSGPEIITVPLSNASPTARMFDLSGNEITSFSFFEPWWEGGYDIAASPLFILAASCMPAETRRRTSIRTLFSAHSETWGIE